MNIKTILACLFAVSALALPCRAGEADFKFDGTNIHPGCFMELLADMADARPVTAAVDLEGCRNSGKYSAKPVVAGGQVRFEDEKLLGKGYFSYKYIGLSSAGRHVVETFSSTDGSGVFSTLLIVKITGGSVYVDGKKQSRTLLQTTGWYNLGDRDDGTVMLRGNRLEIGKSRNRDKAVTIKIG